MLRLNLRASLFIATCLAACDPGPVELSTAGPSQWRSDLTLVSSHWRDLLRGQDVLRTGDALYLQTVNPALAVAGLRYSVEITVQRTGARLALAQEAPLADALGAFDMAPLLNDVGVGDGVSDGDALRVAITAAGSAAEERYVVDLPVGTRALGAPEVFDPWVQACDAQGTPANAFVIEGDRLASERGGPVYVVASGIEPSFEQVDVLVVEDRDRWSGRAIPRDRREGLVKGPIRAKVSPDGRVGPISTGFIPRSTGLFDILLDVDRDGRFDYDEVHKDGADGEAKVGFTVQHSVRWIERMRERHLLVNLAYDSSSRTHGIWRNAFKRGEAVFVYVNPPVNREHHGQVTKWIVHHRDFASFWDQPGADGKVAFSRLAVLAESGEPQAGCTNTPPTHVGPAEPAPDPDGAGDGRRFDVVLDYNGDGMYEAGVDILDVAGIDGSAALLDPAAVRAIPAGEQGGFVVLD